MLEACDKCRVIIRYNINTAESGIVYNGCKPKAICKGPTNSVFFMTHNGELLQFEWSEESEELKMIHRIQTQLKTVQGTMYMKQYNALVITSGRCIAALYPVTGAVLWEFTQDVEGMILYPRGLSCDDDGQIYVADGFNERLVLLNGKNGDLLQVLLRNEETCWIYDISWTNSPPQITVLCGPLLKIRNYDILEL